MSVYQLSQPSRCDCGITIIAVDVPQPPPVAERMTSVLCTMATRNPWVFTTAGTSHSCTGYTVYGDGTAP